MPLPPPPLPPSVPSAVLGPLAPSARLSRGSAGPGTAFASSNHSPLYRNEWKEVEEEGQGKAKSKGKGWEAFHSASHPQSMASSPSLASSARPAVGHLSPLQLSAPPLPSSSSSSSSSPSWPSLSSSPSLVPSSVPSSHFSSPFHSSSLPSSTASVSCVPHSVPMSPLVLPHRLSLSRVPPLPLSALTGAPASRRPSTAPSDRPSPLSSPTLTPQPLHLSPSLSASPTFYPSPPHSFPSRPPSLLDLSGSASPVWSPCPSPPLPPLLSLNPTTAARQRQPQRRQQMRRREEPSLTVGVGGVGRRGGALGRRQSSAPLHRCSRHSFHLATAICLAVTLLLSIVAVLSFYIALGGGAGAVKGRPLPAVAMGRPPPPHSLEGHGRGGEEGELAQLHHHSAHAREDAMLRQQVEDFHLHMQQHHTHAQHTTPLHRPAQDHPDKAQHSRSPVDGEVEKGAVNSHHSLVSDAPADAPTITQNIGDEAKGDKGEKGALIHIVDADKWRH